MSDGRRRTTRRQFCLGLGGAGVAAAAGSGRAASDHTAPTGSDRAGAVSEVLVEFGSVDVDPERSRAAYVDALRDRAAATRGAFRAVVADQPGVTVEREFWLANAVLARVDTAAAAAVSLADLRAVDGVTDVRPHRTAPGAQGAGALAVDGPTAAFEFEPADPAPGQPVTFDAAPSRAASGELVQYDWGLFDENDNLEREIGSGEVYTHVFDEPDTYRVALRVVDEAGDADVTVRPVTVAADGDGGTSTDTGDGGDDTRATGEGPHTAALEQMNVPGASERFDTLGEGVAVGVFDTGVSPAGHDGIAASLDRGGFAAFDEGGERLDRRQGDQDGHGTRVSGIVAGGRTDEGVRYGVAPGVDLYHATAPDSEAGALAALEWLFESGVDVLSASLGPLRYSRLWRDAVETAAANGVLVVGAVANTHRYSSASPANLPTALGVGAVAPDGTVPEWSAGERVDTDRYWGETARPDWPAEYLVPEVTAPGVGVLVSEPGGQYDTNEGASYAAPHAAGVAALTLAATGADHDAVREALVETAVHPATGDPLAVDPGRDDRAGSGVVDALGAIARLRASESVAGTVTTADGTPVAGATVRSEMGVEATADADGSVTLEVPPGPQEITAQALGFEPATETIDSTETDRQTFQLDPAETLAVRLTDSLPERVAPGEAASVTVAAANAETVEVRAVTDHGVDPADLSLSIDGESASFETPVPLDTQPTPEGAPTVTITVGTAADAGVGEFAPFVRFEGGGDVTEGLLERVHVHADPLLVDTDGVDLGTAIDAAAPGARVELTDGTFTVPVGEQSRAGLVLSDPVTLTAADGAEPKVLAEPTRDSPDAPAVFVGANDVELSGLSIDAAGTRAAVVVGTPMRGRDTVAPSGVTLSGLTVAGGVDGVVTNQAPTVELEGSDVTARAVGVRVAGVARATVRENRIHGVETGVAVDGLVTDLSENTIEDVERAGIRVGSPDRESPPLDLGGPGVANNHIEGGRFGVVVYGSTGNDVAGNEIRDAGRTGILVEGTVAGSVVDNELVGTEQGIVVVDGGVGGDIAGNEFRDVGSEVVRTDDHDPVGDSSMDLLLYAAAAGSVGALLLPYGMRRSGGLSGGFRS